MNLSIRSARSTVRFERSLLQVVNGSFSPHGRILTKLPIGHDMMLRPATTNAHKGLDYSGPLLRFLLAA
jgi:hypothetical protein